MAKEVPCSIDGYMELVHGGIGLLLGVGFSLGSDNEVVRNGMSDISTGLFFRKDLNQLSCVPPKEFPALEDPIFAPALDSMLRLGERAGAFDKGIVLRYATDDPFFADIWHKRPGQAMTRHLTSQIEL